MFTTLPNDLYSMPTCQILYKMAGSNVYKVLGDAEDVNIEVNVETKDVYSNEYAVRTKIKTIVTQTGATINLTLKQLSGFVRACSLMASEDTMVQAAVIDASVSLSDVEAGGIYKLPHLNVSNVTITGKVEGVDFKVDAEAGFIESITLTGDVTLTYDAAAITSGHQSGIANNPSIRCEIVLRGQNAEGPRSLVQLWDVELRPSSSRNLISSEDNVTVQLTGTCYPVNGKAEGYRIGQEQTLG